jgi:hypothetical protein
VLTAEPIAPRWLVGVRGVRRQGEKWERMKRAGEFHEAADVVCGAECFPVPHRVHLEIIPP